MKPMSHRDDIKAEYDRMTDEQLLAERDRLADLDQRDDARERELDSQMFRRTGAADGDITDQYFYVRVELGRAEARIKALEEHTERLCAEFEGTYDYIQTVIDGDATGDDNPLINYERLIRDLSKMRELDERVIAAARKLLDGGA
jgi:hypothetical protein